MQLQSALDTVRTWRGRFAHGGLPALADRKRSGRPARFTPVQVAVAKALACQLPDESGIQLSRWSCPELAAELTARGITAAVSASTVRRWLREDAHKPWQYQSWIFITDPDFRPKAQRVLDLYARTLEGEQLGADEYGISADEKTSVQARCRCHPSLAPGQTRAMRVNHTYGRGGALAAYDVHRAKAFGRCEPRTGIDPFMRLVTQVMAQEPYASAKRVFWTVDNGSSHRGQKSVDRLAAAFPNAVLVHTPVHASWLATSMRSGTGSENSKTATTPRPSRSSGSSPPPTRTIYWPDSTGTNPAGTKNPPSPWPHDQPPKDLRRRPLSLLTMDVVDTGVLIKGGGATGPLRPRTPAGSRRRVCG
ncbi:IS630 family transposase [Streptomyces sp. HB132]|uniref:IS630 family transposase n=1 Tax=Streptomyces sp. HB132 TaxID=767388 RepID=UPI001D591858|nr:IS630 family transposase [Streptomyces sp. HB132]MBM7439393.1 hypothetical protein [Streptomyces sp. HB132]